MRSKQQSGAARVANPMVSGEAVGWTASFSAGKSGMYGDGSRRHDDDDDDDDDNAYDDEAYDEVGDDDDDDDDDGS